MHATTQAEASCCLCWAWTIWWELQCKPRPATICARLAATWSELQCLPKLAAIAIVGFAILWVSLQCELRQVTCLKEPLGEQVGQNGSQGDTRVGWMILAKLMERERFYACLCQPAGWVERSTKEQLCLPELLSMGRVAPVLVYPTLALKLVNLVPPHISMLLLELLPLWWSLEQVSFLWKSVKSSISVSWSTISLRLNPHSFQRQLLWELLFPAQVSQAGKPAVGLGSLTLQWESLYLSKLSLPSLKGPTDGVGPAHSASPPLPSVSSEHHSTPPHQVTSWDTTPPYSYLVRDSISSRHLASAGTADF